MKRVCHLAFLLALVFGPVGAAEAAPQVVATIKPIHSLVSAVMAGVGEPVLLVRGGASPHTYSLKPSDAEALQNADVVFWTGHGLELFLEDALGTLTGDAEVVELARTPDLTLYPPREGGAFETHASEAGGHHDHGAPGVDMHFWLDPQNAKLMVASIAAALSEADPENAQAYSANATAETAALEALTAELQGQLAPVTGKPFVVFHDAYQYFEKRFGLTIAGAFTVTPEVTPGAQRIAELKSRVTELGATCVFAEPQFRPTIIAAVTEGTSARSGVLDPEASQLSEGSTLYPELLRSLAASLTDCLAN